MTLSNFDLSKDGGKVVLWKLLKLLDTDNREATFGLLRRSNATQAPECLQLQVEYVNASDMLQAQ